MSLTGNDLNISMMSGLFHNSLARSGFALQNVPFSVTTGSIPHCLNEFLTVKREQARSKDTIILRMFVNNFFDAISVSNNVDRSFDVVLKTLS